MNCIQITPRPTVLENRKPGGFRYRLVCDFDILEGREESLGLRAKCFRVLGKRYLAEKDEEAAWKIRTRSSMQN